VVLGGDNVGITSLTATPANAKIRQAIDSEKGMKYWDMQNSFCIITC